MTSTMSSNGHAPSGLLVVQNGRPRPIVGQEKGTIFDNVAGDLIFSTVPGESTNEGLVYEWRTPTILQLKEMLDHDGRARSLEQALIMPIAGADWTLENGDDDIMAWVEDILKRATISGGMETPMSDVIAQKAEAFIFRASFHEKVWKVSDDNKVVYQKIAWRPPETCTLRRDRKSGDLRGFAQWVLGEPTQVLVDLPYADVYIHGARRDPNRGICDLTVTYNNYRIKEKLKYLWYTYCEVLSLPRQVILATGETEGRKAANAIAALKNAGVAGIPAQWIKEIKEISVAGKGSSDFQDAIGYLDSDSALSLLAGFSELPGRAMGSGSSHGPLGSYALAESSQNFFVSLLQSYANELDAQITNSIISDLVRYNEGVNVEIPQFRLDMNQKVVQASYAMLQELLIAPPPENVPAEFVQEIVMVVAKELGMDTNVILTAMKKQQAAYEAAAVTAQAAANAGLKSAAGVGVQSVQAELQRQGAEEVTHGEPRFQGFPA
jgi:Protein of unknown function (DUF935)